MLNYKGQSLQDAFAYEITGNNGTYIEIGAAFPVTGSNTYALEVDKKRRDARPVVDDIQETHVRSQRLALDA